MDSKSSPAWLVWQISTPAKLPLGGDGGENALAPTIASGNNNSNERYVKRAIPKRETIEHRRPLDWRQTGGRTNGGANGEMEQDRGAACAEKYSFNFI